MSEYDVDVIEIQRIDESDEISDVVEEIIRDLQTKYDGDPGAPEYKVIERAKTRGIKRERAEHGIQKLCDTGDIYSPDQDHLRLV